MGAIIFFIIFFKVFVFIFLVAYLVKSIGIYLMAKKLNMDNAFLAFIPIARSYLLGEICGPIEIFDIKVEQTGMLLLVTELLLFIPFFNTITSVIYLIIFYLVFYEIVKKYMNGKEAVLTIFSVIFNSLGIPYIVYIIIASKYMDGVNGEEVELVKEESGEEKVNEKESLSEELEPKEVETIEAKSEEKSTSEIETKEE